MKHLEVYSENKTASDTQTFLPAKRQCSGLKVSDQARDGIATRRLIWHVERTVLIADYLAVEVIRMKSRDFCAAGSLNVRVAHSVQKLNLQRPAFRGLGLRLLN